MRAADRAWVTIGVGVLAYELLASLRRHDWELLSEACDRHRRRHPIIVNATITYLALHLMRGLPAHIDPLHQIARIGRR